MFPDRLFPGRLFAHRMFPPVVVAVAGLATWLRADVLLVWAVLQADPMERC